jgi:hypothetical protein
MFNQKYCLVNRNDVSTVITFVDDPNAVFGGEWGSVDSEGNHYYIIIPYQRPLDDLKADKIAEINAKCKEVITGGIMSDALGEMHKYDSDIEDQLNFQQAMGLSQITGQPVPYRIWNTDGKTKAFYHHTLEQFQKVLVDGATMKSTALEKCATLKENVSKALSSEEVEAIKWD